MTQYRVELESASCQLPCLYRGLPGALGALLSSSWAWEKQAADRKLVPQCQARQPCSEEAGGHRRQLVQNCTAPCTTVGVQASRCRRVLAPHLHLLDAPPRLPALLLAQAVLRHLVGVQHVVQLVAGERAGDLAAAALEQPHLQPGMRTCTSRGRQPAGGHPNRRGADKRCLFCLQPPGLDTLASAVCPLGLQPRAPSPPPPCAKPNRQSLVRGGTSCALPSHLVVFIAHRALLLLARLASCHPRAGNACGPAPAAGRRRHSGLPGRRRRGRWHRGAA